jgi:SAM-dependent methyltransferase
MEKMDNWNIRRAANWHLFLPPARPSGNEMSHYERVALSEGSSESDIWALLGSTPEIRSLASEHGKRLVCIDTNEEVYKVLHSMVNPASYAEIFIGSDWLHVDLPASIDIVFADGSINMLPPNKQEQLISATHRMLKPEGRALFRIHVVEPPTLSTPQEVFEWYRANRTTEPVFSATRTHLDMLWMDRETLCLNFSDFHRRIQALFDNQEITFEEYQAYNSLLEYNKIDLYYIRREQFETWCKGRFVIEEVIYGNDYSCKTNHPLYVLRKAA